MRLPALVINRLAAAALRAMSARAPDFIIGGADDPYLLRWFVIPRNGFFNVYLHEFRRSDDDRALHDHPWLNVSILIDNAYTEHTIERGGINVRMLRKFGDVVMRGPRHAHRVELHAGICRTIFITGPRMRQWGFHCPEFGWVHWERFTAPGDKGAIGKGCAQ